MRKWLLVLVISMVCLGLFAGIEATKSIPMRLSIGSICEIKVSTEAAESITRFDSAVPIEQFDLAYQSVQAPFYVLVKTNHNLPVIIRAKIRHLQAGGLSIYYKLRSGATIIGNSDDTGETPFTILQESGGSGGKLRILSRQLNMELLSGSDYNSFENASVGIYTTNIVFELLTI